MYVDGAVAKKYSNCLPAFATRRICNAEICLLYVHAFCFMFIKFYSARGFHLDFEWK